MIIVETFSSPAEHAKANANNVNKLRNQYFSGKAKVQCLHLRYIGFNTRFFEALIGPRQGPESQVVGVKRSLSTTPEPDSALKRTRDS